MHGRRPDWLHKKALREAGYSDESRQKRKTTKVYEAPPDLTREEEEAQRAVFDVLGISGSSERSEGSQLGCPKRKRKGKRA